MFLTVFDVTSLYFLAHCYRFPTSSASHLLMVQHARYGSLVETTDFILLLLMIRRGSKIALEAIKSFWEGATAELVRSLGSDSGDSKQQ